MRKSKYKLLVSETDHLNYKALDTLKEYMEITVGDFSRTELIKMIETKNILWVRLKHFIDREIMNASKDLLAIATPTTGLNHIDVEEAAKLGIKIFSLKGETDFLSSIRATAEHTMALVFALLRNLPGTLYNGDTNTWTRELIGEEIFNKTIGIIGYGRIGKIVAQYFSAYEPNEILVYDPYVGRIKNTKVIRRCDDLDEVLRQSDIITIHVDFRRENIGFIGKKQFKQMKPGAYLLNTSRGELINEQQLIEALREKRIKGAALDVISEENFIDEKINPLLTYAKKNSNLILTPHIGGFTIESLHKVESYMAEKIKNYVEAV